MTLAFLVNNSCLTFVQVVVAFVLLFWLDLRILLFRFMALIRLDAK